MPDIPIELSTAGFPVPVQIALVLAATIAPLAMFVWWRLGMGLSTLQTPVEIREAGVIRRFLVYLAVFVLVLAFMVGLVFIAIHTWNILNSSTNSAPEQRNSDSARLNRFPSKEHQEASPYGGRDGEADGTDENHR